jgi:hypothetical protein
MDTLREFHFERLAAEYTKVNDRGENWDDYIKCKKPLSSWLVNNNLPREGLDRIYPAVTAFIANNFKLNNVGKPNSLVPGLDTSPIAAVGGYVCGQQYLKDNFDFKDLFYVGLYLFLNLPNRSLTVVKQSSLEGSRYSSLVPTILAAHKQWNDIPYNAWSKTGLDRVVTLELAKAMLFVIEGTLDEEDFYLNRYGISKEKLLDVRSRALTDGKGKPKNVLSTFKPNNIGENFDKFPWFVKVQAIQCWLAHPAYRGDYMVLDHKAWDNKPDILLDDGIFFEAENGGWRSTKKEPSYLDFM